MKTNKRDFKKKESKFPKGYMSEMKKKKNGKIRKTPIDELIIDQQYNDAEYHL